MAQIFKISALVAHIWVVIVAFQESGFFGGLLSLFLPFLSELYWMFAMWGENDLFVTVCAVHLVSGGLALVGASE